MALLFDFLLYYQIVLFCTIINIILGKGEMKYPKLSKQLVNLRVLLEHVSEGNCEDATTKGLQLSMRLKTLFTISNNENCAPALLIERLNIAKSNLAIICKGLIKEDLILAEKTKEDKRNIFYNITPKGQKELDSYFAYLENKMIAQMSTKELKLIERKVDELSVLVGKALNKK